MPSLICELRVPVKLAHGEILSLRIRGKANLVIGIASVIGQVFQITIHHCYHHITSWCMYHHHHSNEIQIFPVNSNSLFESRKISRRHIPLIKTSELYCKYIRKSGRMLSNVMEWEPLFRFCEILELMFEDKS